MRKRRISPNRRVKNKQLSPLSRRELREKAMEPSDKFSDVVVVALGLNRDNSFSTLKRYLKSWKKIMS